jgi:hypothetical protein
MAPDGITVARSVGFVRYVPRMAVLVAVAAISVFAAACSSSGATVSQHGVVIGHLSIPFMPNITTGGAEIIAVTVQAGQRFSVEVDTSDGPEWWTQTGAGPDSRIVKVVGNFNVGSCPADMTGCRVPYYRTLIARSPGTTTMTWRYNSAPCRAPTTSPASKQCPSVTEVQFDIDVR